MKNSYDEDYYERGIEKGISGYTNYRWIPELTIPMASRIIEYLKIGENETILDYGCAKGYLTYALRLLHRNAYGYDISDYAIEHAPREVEKYLYTEFEQLGEYDWCIAKDVFEHIPEQLLRELLEKLRVITKHMFVIVPLAEDGKYVVPAYEHDSTHVIRKNLKWWEEIMIDSGFKVRESTYRVRYIKENYANYEKGNGFLVLD